MALVHCEKPGLKRRRICRSVRVAPHPAAQDLARLLRSGNVEQHRDVLERPQAAAALAGERPTSGRAACPSLLGWHTARRWRTPAAARLQDACAAAGPRVSRARRVPGAGAPPAARPMPRAPPRAAVLAFGEALADGASHGKWALSLYDTGRYMRMDAAAARALNVMRQRTDANDAFSLYGLLNRGRTAMAKRLLKVPRAQWLAIGEGQGRGSWVYPLFEGFGTSPVFGEVPDSPVAAFGRRARCQRRVRVSQDQHALARRFVRSGRHESAESVRSVTATLGPGAHATNRWLPQLSTPAARGAAARAAGAQVWLKQPLVSLADINTRHDVVEALVSDPELRERLHDSHLRGASAAAACAVEPGAPALHPDAVRFSWSA